VGFYKQASTEEMRVKPTAAQQAENPAKESLRESTQQLEVILAFWLAALKFEEAGQARLAERVRRNCYALSSRGSDEADSPLGALVDQAEPRGEAQELLLAWIDRSRGRPGRQDPLPKALNNQAVAALKKYAERLSPAICAQTWARQTIAYRSWLRLRHDVLPRLKKHDDARPDEGYDAVPDFGKLTAKLGNWFEAKVREKRRRLGAPVGMGESIRTYEEFLAQLKYIERFFSDSGWGPILGLHQAFDQVDSRCKEDEWKFWPPIAAGEFLDTLELPPGFQERLLRPIEGVGPSPPSALGKAARFHLAARLLRTAEEDLGLFDEAQRTQYTKMLRRLFPAEQAELITGRPLGATDPGAPEVDEVVRPELDADRLERHGLRVVGERGDQPFRLPARMGVAPYEPRLLVALRRIMKLARETDRREMEGDARTLLLQVQDSRATTLAAWWKGLAGRDAQLRAAQLVHAVVLGVTAASRTGADWAEAASHLIRDLTEDGTFQCGLSDATPATAQPFDGGFIRFERSITYPVELRAGAAIDRDRVVVLRAEGLGDIAPVTAVLIPAAWQDQAKLPAFLAGLRVRLEFLRRHDPDFGGWRKFDEMLRSVSPAFKDPGSDDPKRAVREMFWALHPRAVPKLYGQTVPPTVNSKDYAALLRELLRGTAADLGLPVDPATLQVGPLKSRPKGWHIKWNVGTDQPHGTVTQIEKPEDDRTLHVVLGRSVANLKPIIRAPLDAPALCEIDQTCANVTALVALDRLRDELPWITTEADRMAAFQACVTELRTWVVTDEGSAWLNRLALRARKNPRGREWLWFGLLTGSEPPFLVVIPRLLEDGSVELPDLRSVPPKVELVKSRLPPGRLVGEEVAFALQPERVRGCFSIGDPPADSPWAISMRIHDLASRSPGSDQFLLLAKRLLRRASDQFLREPGGVFDPGRDLFRSLLGVLAQRSQRVLGDADADRLGELHGELVRLAQQAGYRIEPSDWSYRIPSSDEQVRRISELVPLRRRYSEGPETGRVQISRFGLRGPAGDVIQPLEASLAVGQRPEGILELEQLLSDEAISEARPVLDYLSSEEWFDGVCEREHLVLKVTHLFKHFWEAFGGDFRTRRPREFDKLYAALKQIFRGPEVHLKLFQEQAGALERDVGWYEASPQTAIFQSSTIEAVIRPGLVDDNDTR
jgi:hypothetical protein